MAFESVLKYESDGLKCEIKNGSGYMGGFNGYITYPKRPLKEPSYYGIATYIPVHGGLTYAKENKDGSFTYGFDTSHCDSEEYPCHSIEWMKSEIEVIKNGIELCQKLEDEYLLAEGNNEKRADICQKVHDIPHGSKGTSPASSFLVVIFKRSDIHGKPSSRQRRIVVRP